MNLKYRIAGLADDRGLTIKKLADLSGIRWSTLYDFTAGRRRLRVDELAKIADALDVTASELLEGVKL